MVGVWERTEEGRKREYYHGRGRRGCDGKGGDRKEEKVEEDGQEICRTNVKLLPT